MTANGVPSCGNLRKKQRPRIAGPSLQTSALPLGYGAVSLKLASYLDFLNPPSEVLPTSFKPLSGCTCRVKNGRDCWPSKPSRRIRA